MGRAASRFGIFHKGGSLWARARFGDGAALAFCVAYALGGPTRLVDVEHVETNRWRIRLHSVAGEYTCCVELPDKSNRALHWRTTLRPSAVLRVQAWPRDILPIGSCGDPAGTAGKIHAAQRGITGNVLFASLTEPDDLTRGSFLYVQNLGALTDYFEQTKGSAVARVGGDWPELGFELPPATDQPLQPGIEYILSDAYVCVSGQIPRTDVDMARLFLELNACVYLRMPRPIPTHRDWPRSVAETARDLSHSPDCGWDIDWHRYVLAYAGSKDRPPESMVQLAVLVPMMEWAESRDVTIPLNDAIRRNLPTFFDDSLKTVVRWLPRKHDLLQGQEEHMKPEVMDAWYLYHTYMNLGRVAARGDAEARRLFFTSIEYGIRVAQRFDYQWPVFYDLNTLDVVKAETQPGRGGERDVGALYAHVMLSTFDLSGDRRFIDEAKRAASRLRGLGFDLGYQFNNVSFGAVTLYRLWKLTGDEQYRGPSELCWAYMVRNLWLCDCNYGHAKHYGTLMGLKPLQDAPYLALYEELEVLAAIHEYMRIAGDDVPQPLRVLYGGGSMRFKLAGDKRCQAFLRVVAENFGALPTFVVRRADGPSAGAIEPVLTPLGYLEYQTPGDAEIDVRWDHSQRFIGGTRLPRAALRSKASEKAAMRPKRSRAKPRKRGGHARRSSRVALRMRLVARSVARLSSSRAALRRSCAASPRRGL